MLLSVPQGAGSPHNRELPCLCQWRWGRETPPLPERTILNILSSFTDKI